MLPTPTTAATGAWRSWAVNPKWKGTSSPPPGTASSAVSEQTRGSPRPLEREGTQPGTPLLMETLEPGHLGRRGRSSIITASRRGMSQRPNAPMAPSLESPGPISSCPGTPGTPPIQRRPPPAPASGGRSRGTLLSPPRGAVPRQPSPGPGRPLGACPQDRASRAEPQTQRLELRCGTTDPTPKG